jgi:DNA-binding MarR family transcriptional regulator
MSDLASQALLSQSRVSRIIDQLEARGLVERQTCTEDSRIVYAVITDRGRQELRAAEETHRRGVESQLFGRLSAREVHRLAEIFGRIGVPDRAAVESVVEG